MQRTHKFGDFEVSVTATEIKVQNFVFGPPDADKIIHLLGIAGTLSTYNTLPGEIKFTPFQISFADDGGLALHKKENPAKAVKFSFEQIDDMLNLVEAATASAIDIIKITPQVRQTVLPGANQGDVFEGRE